MDSTMSDQQVHIRRSMLAPEHPKSKQPNGQLIWYCPSRWLLAHHDPKANINTLSSHICLADLNNDGESLLALIDFKKQHLPIDGKSLFKSPYECRMRVYRGQQLIYNHFLDDIPSCLIATSVTDPFGTDYRSKSNTSPSNAKFSTKEQHHHLLTMPIMDDVYFYKRLRPSHKLSLEDETCILDSLVRSEVDAWQMVKQNKVDTEAMHDLLNGLSQELGNQELTSHSLNYLALDTSEARKQYLVAWKFKRLQDGHGEHIMSLDTICCAAARLKFSSTITKSGDFGQTQERGSFLNNSRWNRIIEMQKDGLVLGSEDRHLLIYELRSLNTRLECHYRLPSVPDHILVERCSPENFGTHVNMNNLTYKILVSCRNCRIYLIDQLYAFEGKSSPCKIKELVALKCNVLEMSWCGVDDSPQDSSGLLTDPNSRSWPLFVVACLDRRVYCFNSHTGQCKWRIEVELPITCLICLPKLRIGLEESSLVGIASKANRIDFYVASSGRIVDSIYFSKNDYPSAAAYGRFGREDNCLCLVSHLGHLLIFILKRTAKFAHGQCLSSAASYASDTLATCGQILQQSISYQEANSFATGGAEPVLKLDKPANVPSAFSLSKSTSATAADQMLDSMLQLDHDCDQVAAKNALEAFVSKPKLQIPTKGRDFVEQILKQSRQSRATGTIFADHMIRLREKIKSTMEQQFDIGASVTETATDGEKRVILSKVTGLGNIYRVSLSIRLNLERFILRYKQLLGGNYSTNRWRLIILIQPAPSTQATNACQVKPFRVSLPIEEDSSETSGIRKIFESFIQFKLCRISQAGRIDSGLDGMIEVNVQVFVSHSSETKETLIRQPLLVTTINVPISQ